VNSPKRVLLDAGALDNGHATRGIGRYASGVLLGLSRLDPPFELDVLRQTCGQNTSSQRRIVPGNPWPGLTTGWKLSRRLGLLLPKLESRTDARILHLLDPLAIPRRRAGWKISVTVHDLIPLLVEEQRVKWSDDWGIARWHYHRVFLRRIASADAVVTPSEAVAEDMVRHLGIPRGRISVILHGADEAPMELAENVAVPPDPGPLPYFLFVGAAELRKNLDRVILALASSGLPHRLVLAGKPGRGNLERLRETAHRAGVAERLLPLGFVSDDALRSLYEGADGLMFPSLAEGFGLPVIEAMREGCPVLTSNMGCLPEAAGNAGLLVDPLDVGAIAHGMRRLAGETSLRDELRRLGRERCRELRWSDAARRLVEVWKSL
jgi:glycosyltransferase involved in cell wall biosynthesis